MTEIPYVHATNDKEGSTNALAKLAQHEGKNGAFVPLTQNRFAILFFLRFHIELFVDFFQITAAVWTTEFYTGDYLAAANAGK